MNLYFVVRFLHSRAALRNPLSVGVMWWACRVSPAQPDYPDIPSPSDRSLAYIKRSWFVADQSKYGILLLFHCFAQCA